ncbi:hypothetical protein [Pinibacter soli]|uniref:Uncharacterized protein n=1 Tax=Pinibacter soli TaxID=3044211 RepID=A0ABT6RDQ8_9BACT|nr:hypothetical protein [Pinibacter soli]MDI3320653.1 hypothetical protein [Pinibacter soli]
MKLVALLLAVSLTVTAHSQSQNTINSYKYVLVPQRFDFLKSDNQYGVNMLTKSLLESVGFSAYLTDETLPAEVAANKCSALKAEVVEKKKFLTTVLTLLLKDCQGNVVFKSVEGKSSEKEWGTAYSEALQNAFVSLHNAHYKYDSTLAAPAAVQTGVGAVPAAAVVAVGVGVPATVTENGNVLYAQANPNGYQLIDTTPKKVMTLLKTSQQDSFIADDGISKGIVFRKNGEWFFEYYKDDKLVSQKLTIKF